MLLLRVAVLIFSFALGVRSGPIGNYRHDLLSVEETEPKVGVSFLSLHRHDAKLIRHAGELQRLAGLGRRRRRRLGRRQRVSRPRTGKGARTEGKSRDAVGLVVDVGKLMYARRRMIGRVTAPEGGERRSECCRTTSASGRTLCAVDAGKGMARTP